GVVAVLRAIIGNVSVFEGDVSDGVLAGAGAGNGEGSVIDVDPGDVAMRADQRRGNERDLADPAADVQHAHSRAYAGALKKPAGEGVENGGLQRQTAALMVGVAHQVCGCRHGGECSSGKLQVNGIDGAFSV